MSIGKIGGVIAAGLLVAGVGSLWAEAVAPSLVTEEALFWLDAAALTEAAGTGIASWPDARGTDYPGATTYTSAQPQVIEIAEGVLAGKKAVSFTNVPKGINQDMTFPRTLQLRTVFFVVDADQNANTLLLGGPEDMDSSSRCFVFYRGSKGEYRYNNPYTTGYYWENGRYVSNTLTAVMPTGYQLVTFSYSEPTYVRYLCSDRRLADHIGSKRVCEIIAFERELTSVERAAVEGYLQTKWFGATSQAEASLAMLGKRAQVHFDAADAASFEYAVEGDDTGTLVSKWNDISGNNNHFTPTHYNASDPKYGTRGTVREKPVFDAGACGSRIDFILATRLTNTRTVFMVADIQRNYYSYWLGDPNTFHYARGSAGQYAYSHNDVYLGRYGQVWENGMAVKDVKGDWPDGPGDLSVFTLATSVNCAWVRLCQDRNTPQTSGGKKVAELMTFAENFSDGDRTLVEGWLMEKWGPTTAQVDEVIARAAVHVDASSSDQFTYNGDQAITGWKNLGTGADLYRPGSIGDGWTTQFGTYGYTNGVPAYSLGPQGSDIEMTFGLISNIKSVFWVMDIQQRAIAFFLGDMKGIDGGAKTYHFCRGTGAPWAYADSTHAHAGFKEGSLTCDGEKVMPKSSVPPSGMHVYDLASPSALTASCFAMDRNCKDGSVHRNGGRAISELLIFTEDVRGLTRRAIRNRLAARWTTGCGWAGAGDAEWGADKYRVFGADAEVPAAGATAAGVGFSSSAQLTGGMLTLGAGGIFASAGTEVEVAAPVAGVLNVNGQGGKVRLANAPSVASLTVGNGATLTLPPYGVVNGGLVLREGSRMIFDASKIVVGQSAALSFDSVTLPGGGSLLDYVSTSDDEHHFLTLSADGKTIIVDDPGVPYTAVWSGLGDRANASDPANWICRNFNGEVLEGMLPGQFTTVTIEGNSSFNLPEGQTFACRRLVIGAVTLTADCDWRGLGVYDLTGAVVDLDGHRLDMVGFKGEGTIGSIVPPAVVLDGTPHSWFDAAGRALLSSMDADNNIHHWFSKGSKGSFCTGLLPRGADVRTYNKRPQYDATTFGRPTVDFGAQNNGVDMTWSQVNVAMGFWVAKMNQSFDTFWLGYVGANYYGFCRGEQGQYGHPSHSNFKTVWDDGVEVDWKNTLVPDDDFRIVCIETSKTTYSNCFATDRGCTGRQGGGRQFSEVILYDRVLSEEERKAVTSYLQRKWSRIHEAPGELHLQVAAGQTLANSTVRLTGNMKLVKEGAGVYRSSKPQDNAGGLQIVAGTVQMGMNGLRMPLGTGDVVIEKDGTFDRSGNKEDPNMHYVLKGGRIVNQGDDAGANYSQIAQLTLTTNSSMTVTSNHGIIQAEYKRALLDLAGNELSVSIANNKHFHLYNADITRGRLVITSSGWLDVAKTSVRAAETDFDLNCKVNLQADAEVHDLTWRYGANDADGACTLRVHGTFYPVTDYFHNVQLQDGAALDLVAKTLPLSTTSLNTSKVGHYCTFAENATVTVKLSGREDLLQLTRSDAPFLVTWDEEHVPNNVKLVPEEELAQRHFAIRMEATGARLYYSGGMVIMLR